MFYGKKRIFWEKRGEYSEEHRRENSETKEENILIILTRVRNEEPWTN